MLRERRTAEDRERVSSAFIGREAQLALALRRWDAAVAGSGHLLFVSGEAGIGKTRLLREIGAALGGARQIGAAVFPRDIEAVGGLLLDLAAELVRTGQTEAATALRDRVLAGAASKGDQSRGRRMLVSDLAVIVTGLLAERPTLLRIEDLHWADELSLDVLERVAGTVRETPSMLIATFRSDELYPRSSLRRLRARLLEQRLAEEVRLPRLDVDETTAMIESIMGKPEPATSIGALFDRSDGIPLHIEELLAGVSESAVPETVADAVAAQKAGLRSDTRVVVEAAAVIGRSFDIDLLVTVSESEPVTVDLALQELADRHLVLPGTDGTTFDFRHALIRDAIYDGVPPLRKRALHAAVASAASAHGLRDAFVSDHFERAHLPAEAYQHALAAAQDARLVSAHREAVDLFRRAQRTAPGTVSDLERARLHQDLAAELGATDDNEGAGTQLAAAIELFRRSGDEASAAALIPRLAAARHLLGAGYDSRAALIDEALERLGALPEPAPVRVRAGLLSALSAAYMLDRCLDDALEIGTQAAALADLDGALDERVDIDLTVGSVLLFAGKPEVGWSQLERAIDRARDAHYEAQAARGYRMIGSSASVLVEYPIATRWIAEGLDYTAATERWNDHHYLAAHHAHVLWATGALTEAESVAKRALADGRGGITTRSTALIVLGYVALGHGHLTIARDRLGEARVIGEDMRELQRLAPALWGLAEVELLDGNPRATVQLCELAYLQSQPVGDAAYVFPFLVTGVRAHLALRDPTAAREWFDRAAYLVAYRDIPGIQPSIAHARGLLELADGQTGTARALLETASAEWDARARFWEGTIALLDLARCAARSRRPADARALVAEARSRADAAGAAALGALTDQFALDRAHGHGPLSDRELEVARLVAEGATNREIAEHLVISPKTASSHLEHILAKLGVSRRSDIAVWVERLPGEAM